MVCLCSKMYFISGDKYDKFSSKGINKNTNDIKLLNHLKMYCTQKRILPQLIEDLEWLIIELCPIFKKRRD